MTAYVRIVAKLPDRTGRRAATVPPMRAVVVRHETNEGPGLLAPALEAAGFRLEPRFRAVAPGDAGAELVVVLGGSMSAWDDRAHPFLADEVALLRTRLADDAPCLGICLGAQLLARAAGAQVFRGAAGLEIGAGPVAWTAAGEADEVTGGLGSELVVAHWHADTFGPVPGATLLARSPRYEQQAFRRGRSYGLQFHVELTGDGLRRWLRAGAAELAAQGIDVTRLADLTPFEADADRRRQLIARLAAALARCART